MPIRTLLLPVSDAQLTADIRWPAAPRAVVVFVHGSGSSRLSPRNQHVAGYLADRQFATVLFDLLTEQEQRIDQFTASLRFDIELLSRRLIEVIDWLGGQVELASLPLGLFAASSGAAAALRAAALRAAASRPEQVRAVVCRGGRSDLTGAMIGAVRAPTLQIVGALDPQVLALNQAVCEQLRCQQQLQIIAGASHLFAEPGALEQVARLAGDWFAQHLSGKAASRLPTQA
jgi:pimeloyl-ACP methyl ester carboxylesterase